MKKPDLKKTAAGMAILMILTAGAVSASAAEKLTVAYQYGLAYAPLAIMQEQQLIEKNFDGEVEIEWVNLNSGAAINEGVISGSIDVANMGVAPFLTGVMAGIPYKMYSTISAQPHRLMTNKEDIKTMEDITPENKIALVNIGSIQHIMLGMACENVFQDAHILDENIVAMSHPDGMTALLAGSVDLQLTTAPYIYQEAEEEGIHEVEGFSEAWPDGRAFIVGLVSDKLVENSPELYEAVAAATEEAILFLNENPAEAAEILSGLMDVEAASLEDWMSRPGCEYASDLDGVMDVAQFMADNGFLEEAPESLEAISTASAE